MSELLVKLLQKIHFYFPIGLPQLEKEYPGRKLIEEKIGVKIDEITDNIETSWIKLRKEIERKFGIDAVRDNSFYQFPNYYMAIELEKSENNGIQFSSSIIINISLLVDYYTIFLQDTHRFENYNNHKNGINILPIVDIVYYKSCRKANYLIFLEALKPMIENVFHGHAFIEHSLLLNAEIQGGYPFGRSEEFDFKNKYSIYEYLFFPYINRDDLLILE